MANYHELTTYELENMHSAFLDAIAKCDDDAELEQLSDELDRIQDELDSRDPLADDN